MNNEDKATLHYLRNSPSDALKREAADLIERQAQKILELQTTILSLAEKTQHNG